MHRLKLTALLLLTILATATAQPAPAGTEALPRPADELKTHAGLSASNMAAYPGPRQTRLTPAPKGYRPFYLSHYGRHGSRFLTKMQDYDYALTTLERAAGDGQLTPLGRDVLQRVRRLQQEAMNRWGDLTPIGAQQHRDIARRMVERFPEVFARGAVVDARSTQVPRCILSMAYATNELQALRPRLDVRMQASHSDAYYLNQQDKVLASKIMSAEVRETYNDYCRRLQCWQRVVGSLFADTAYVTRHVNGERLNYYLFRLAGSVQNSELSGELTLYDLFTPDEITANWQMENAYWYLGYAHTPLNGGMQPFCQRNLLRRIVVQADSCISLPHPTATLRFGHETVLLPLTCLMGLNGADLMTGSMDSLDLRGWVNYRIYPMAGNVQLVFYRRNTRDADVLVKVLLNENEATLPVESSMAPYYRWSDVRSYFLRKLDTYPDD